MAKTPVAIMGGHVAARKILRLTLMLFSCGFLLLSVPAFGQNPEVFLPNFFDLQNRIARPDLGNLKVLRFITEDDYPPFHFALPDVGLVGFDIDLARAICQELELVCTIQQRRIDTMIEALDKNEADVMIAGLPLTAANRQLMAFSSPYYRLPARFAVQKADNLQAISPVSLAGREVGVLLHSAHAAYMQDFFPSAHIHPFLARAALQAALKAGEVEVVFDDGLALSFWLNGAEANECCRFVGGPYTESSYFGEGIGLAVQKDALNLRQALNYALWRISQKGIYGELYLKWFPVSYW